MENRISKGYLGGTSPAALPPNRKSGWRYKPTLSAFTIILAILSIFALTALTPQGAMAKNGYDKDISDNHGTALWQDKNDTCGHCHANWDGGGARGDGAYYWKMFDYSSMDAGIHADLIDLDIFRVGVSTTTKISGEASTNPAPFYGAADKDGDGYVQLDYRTDLTGMPLYILIDTGSDGPTTTPTGWDVDDNDNLQGNTAWGTNTSVGTTDSTVPAQTTDLTAGSLAATSLPITWTASGDDGTTGTAHHYDIRFSTESIINTDFSYDPRNAAHWLTMWDLIDCSIKGTAESALLKTGFGSTGACASAQTVNQGEASPLMRMVLESAPQAPGNTENMTITAITPGGASPYTTIPNIIADGTTYWVALRTSDGVFAATGGGPFDRTDADVTSRTGFTENLSAVSNVIAMTAGAAGEAITAVSHSTWNSTVSTDITVTGLGLDATNANKLVLTDSTGATVATGTALNRTGETSLTGTFCEGGAISTGFHTIEVQTSGGVTKAAWVDAVNVTDGSACGGGGDSTTLSDGTGTAQTYAIQSESDVEGGVFNIAVVGTGDTVDSITIAIGANWADISNVHIYRDLSTLGTYDAESDISGSPVVPSSASVSFTTSEAISAGTNVDYLITYDFTGSAGDTNTYTANVSAFTATTNSTSGTDPTDGTTTLDASAPTTSALGDGGSYTFGDWVTGPQVSVTLSEADATSGVASSQYCRNASSGCVPGTGYSGAYNVPTAACTAGNVCTEYTGFRSLDNVGILQTTVEETVNIDLKGPDAEAFSADVASATQCDVSYSALTNDPGIGTYDASPYQIVRLQGSDPAADCSSGTTITGGWTSSTTTVNDSGRTEGLPYNYRICYKDSLGNISTQATSICTPAAGATTVLSDGTGTAQAYAVQSEADVEGGVFNIVANSGGDTVDSITIAIGANWADISNVHIYRDLSTLGTYDAESDISGSPVVPSSSSVSFTTNETLVADTAVDYLITYDFKAGAGDTNTYTANVSAFTVTTNPDSGSDPTDGTTTIDASAPSYAWVAPAASTYYMDGDGITFDVTVTETGSSVNGTDCTPLIDGVATEFTGTVTYGAGSCTGTITLDDPSALSDGAVSLTVEIGDNVGNSSQSAARSVNIDNTSPDAPTNVSPTNADYTSDTTPTFDWSDVADASGVTYEIQVDDSGAGYPSAEEDVTGLGTSTYTPAGALSETTHTWHARAVDNVGNPAGAWGPDWTITVDNTNPTVNTGTSSPADTDTGISVTTSITVEFLNGPIDCTTVNVDTSLYLEDDSGPTLIPAVGSDYDSCGDTQVVFTPASTLAQNQSHTVFYTGGVSDKAGNPLTPGNYSFVTQSVADGDPPDWDNFPTTEGVRKVIDDGTDGSMTVCFDSATDAVSTPESYFMYYNTASPASGGSNINMGTAPTAGSGNCAGYAYMYTKTGLDNGTKYFVTVRARDAVGNFTTNEDDMVGIPYYRTLGLTGYNMISLPGETSAAAPDSLFGDDLSYRRVMGWNGRYTLVNNSSGSFAEGAGYWLLNRSGSTSTLIDIDASGGDCNTYSCYTAQVTSPVNVSVYRGWTLIGNPCITNVTGTNISLNLTASSASCGGDAVCTFDEANSGGFIKNTSYRWNGTNYTTDAPVLSAGDSAEPWKGYWFYVKNTTPYVATIDITCSAQ
jgi:hypothetical protein